MENITKVKSLEELTGVLFDRALDKSEDGLVTISSEDLNLLRENKFSVEDFFNRLVRTNNYLLHGSTNEFTDSIKPTKLKRGTGQISKYGSKLVTFATPFGSMAMMKAIVSNKNASLSYDWWISGPLTVSINDLNEDTIKENGFVYLIEGRNDFVNGSRYLPLEHLNGRDLSRCVEWVRSDGRETPFIARIEVSKEDLLPYHNIRNGDTDKRIIN